jgi:hypothetical protein
LVFFESCFNLFFFVGMKEGWINVHLIHICVHIHTKELFSSRVSWNAWHMLKFQIYLMFAWTLVWWLWRFTKFQLYHLHKWTIWTCSIFGISQDCKFFLVCGKLIKEAHHQKKKNVLGVHPTNFYMLVLKFTHLLESCVYCH